MTRQKLLDLFTRVIALRTGFYEAGSQAQCSNNPGGLRWWCGLPVVGGMVVFESEADGWEALRAQCANNIFRRGLNFEEFFAGKPGTYRGFAPEWDARDTGDFAVRFIRKRDTRVPDWYNSAVQIKQLVTEA